MHNATLSTLAATGFVTLEREDLIAYEQHLHATFGRFLPFGGHSLHFPAGVASDAAWYDEAEASLYVPLFTPAGEQGESALLGVSQMRQADPQKAASLLPLLPGIAATVVEGLIFHKRSQSDAVTGLATRQHLLDSLSGEIDGMRGSGPLAAMPSGDATSGASGNTTSNFALLCVRLDSLRDVVRAHGYLSGDQASASMAAELREVCGRQGLCARISDAEFAVYLPGASGTAARRLGGELAARLSAVTVEDTLGRRAIPARAAVGYALYPQDMDGPAFGKAGSEQARILIRKARMAAAFSAERRGTEPVGQVLGFGRILAEGGRVLEVYPLSRLTVSLGRNMNAREGQRFSVWSPSGRDAAGPASYKGEIALMEVRGESSTAEVIHVGDPTWAIAPGDSLALLPDDAAEPLRRDGGEEKRDPLTGLLRHGDFLARWSAERESCDTFTLALLRLDPHAAADEAEAVNAEHLVTEAVRLLRDRFGRDLLGGRYGLNSLILFHPGIGADEAGEAYTAICSELAARFFPGREDTAGAAAGLAAFPFLRSRKAECLENCLKALDYALLLPSPHVGVLDSLALTISADKRFSRGDIFGAVEEYRLALSADEGNVLAWNSLGVSLAGMGRHDEARRCFTEALSRQPQDAMALYNMGHSCQCLGESAEAEDWFGRCLAAHPSHVFSLLRLGQLAEARSDHDAARQRYTEAREAGASEALVLRHLAALALARDERQEARELLHETLNRDPRNAHALYLMARLYLDGGEDAEVAESLARQSVAIRPDCKPAWLELARAMELRGKSREAREILIKAAQC